MDKLLYRQFERDRNILYNDVILNSCLGNDVGNTPIRTHVRFIRCLGTSPKFQSNKPHVRKLNKENNLNSNVASFRDCGLGHIVSDKQRCHVNVNSSTISIQGETTTNKKEAPSGKLKISATVRKMRRALRHAVKLESSRALPMPVTWHEKFVYVAI